MINIVDNWLEKDLSDFAEHSFLHVYPHHFDHTPTDKDDKTFYNCELNDSDMLVNYYFIKHRKQLIKN